MYLRRCYRHKDGKRHGYWALVESYRSSRGPRQRVVAYLGEMDAAGRLGIHQQAAGAATVAQRGLFRDVAPQWVEVDLQRIAVERKRALGGPWLGLELSRQVGLVDFLEQTLPTGREEIPWAVMAQILILARLCDPSSELQIAAHFYEASALSDLLGVPASKVNEDRLYRALDQLLPHKEALERHLKNRLGELFDLDYDLLLYDVTSTYFEGEAKRNGLAQRGYSRDHRPDCQQVNLALVVSRDGMPLGYQVFAGNRNDVTTLEEIVERIERLCGKVWRCGSVRPRVARRSFFSAGARTGNRKSRPCTSGSRSGSRRDSRRSRPVAGSASNGPPPWGSGSDDYWARTHGPQERLPSRSTPMPRALRSSVGRKWIAGGSGHGSVRVVMCCAAT